MNYFNLRDTVIGAGTGLLYGFALNKSGLLKPRVLREQFELKDFTLLKCFGASIATGTVSTLVATSLGYSALVVKPKYTWSNIIGGAIVGASVYLTGSSPETAVAQLGIGKKRSLLLVSGGIVGSLIYGFIQKPLESTILGEAGSLCSIHGILGVSYPTVAIPFIGLLVGGLYLLEQMYPSFTPLIDKDPIQTSSASVDQKLMNYMEKDRWNPYISGILIGLTQLPISMFMNNVFGVTSTYAMLTGHLVALFGTTTAFFESQKTPGHFWLAPLHVGSMLGSSFAGKSNKLKEKKVASLTATQISTAFFGGLIGVLGTCIANGSVSAHGLSGLSQLNCGSIYSTLAMFGGGVIAAQILSPHIHSL